MAENVSRAGEASLLDGPMQPQHRRPRLLVTGASGYLGRELARRGRAAGWCVMPTDLHPDHQNEILDVCDPHAVDRVLGASDPDCVIHAAYVQDGRDAQAVTVGGAATVAAAAHRRRIRLIHMSSDIVFAGNPERGYREDDTPSPVTVYGRAKADAELIVRECCPQALLVRTSLLYGGPAPSRHELLALGAADGRTRTTFFTEELRCPTHVGDLAAALLEVASMEIAGILHLAGADVVSRYEFACLVVAQAGRDPGLLRPGISADVGQRRPGRCALDSTRAARLVRTRLRGAREVLGPARRAWPTAAPP